MDMSSLQSNISMHHYGCVTLDEASILQKGRFWAASLASSSSMSNEVRSPLMFLSQVERSCPGGLLQSSSRGSNSIRFASASPSIRAICPNSERRLLLTMEESGVVQSCDRYHHFWRSGALRVLLKWQIVLCYSHLCSKLWFSTWICW